MSTTFLDQDPRPFDMPNKPDHRNLRRRVGTAFVSGALALTMFPTLALAQPGDANDTFNPNGQAMGQMEQMSQPPAMPEGGMQMPQGDFGGFGMQQPPAMDNNQAPDQQQNGNAGEMTQPPSQNGDQSQQGQQTQPPANDNGQQPAQEGQGQPNGQQQGQPGQPGDQNQQGQMGQPGQMGQMGQQPPVMPEQARELIERVYDILGIDKEANPIEQIMGQLGFGLQNAMNNMMGQPPSGQPGQMGQPGQGSPSGQQPGQMGQPGQNSSSNQSGQMGQPGQPGGMSNAPTSYDAANKPDADASGATYQSTADNENAVLVDGKTLNLSNVTISKTGSASGEDADFYGINAAILANNGANLTITGANVTSNGTHANGVFSYGAGTTVSISDSTITTTGNNSGGLMTTGGATLNATNMQVSTSGNSSAAIRTDRGGGTVTAAQGSYSTSGVGSPAVYSTADITVKDATLSASSSEAVVIEGGNSVTLENVNATGSNTKLNGQSTVKTNVLIYQSMSGDASEGASYFTMTDGSLTSKTGSMFHVTNTTTTISLTNVALNNAADSDDFLIATADSWGTAGKNGGHATVNLTEQTASGNITVDSVSSVTLNLVKSSYTGAIANDGTVKVVLDANSTWTLTGDSYVTSLDGDTSGINLNGHTLYVNGVAFAG